MLTLARLCLIDFVITNFISRYWSVSSSGITGLSYGADATYLAADVTGSEASLSAQKFASPWVSFGLVNIPFETNHQTALLTFF